VLYLDINRGILAVPLRNKTKNILVFMYVLKLSTSRNFGLLSLISVSKEPG
jgi:hypothetical protein